MFDENQVKKHYRFLNHTPYGVTELTAIDSSGRIAAIGFFDNEEKFVQACRKLAGSCNLYVGVNPRRREMLDLAPNQMQFGLDRRGRKKDVTAITAMFLDIDPVREARTPSTDLQSEQALAKARELASLPIFEGAGVVSSGNGAYVLAKLNIQGDLQSVERKIKALEKKIGREHFTKGDGLKLDSVQDISHLMAVAGTLKMKGQEDAEHPHRVARFCQEPSTEPSGQLQKQITQPDDHGSGLGKKTVSPGSRVSRPKGSPGQLCSGLQQILDNPPPIPHRSEFYLKVVSAMLGQEWTRDQIRETLLHLDQRLILKSGKRDKKFLDRSPDNQESLLDHYLAAADPNYMPCGLVYELLESRECAQDCLLLGKNLSGRKYQISAAANAPKIPALSLEKARIQLRQDLISRKELLIEECGLLIVHDAPGLGKNVSASEVFKDKRMLVLTSRNNELGKICQDLAGGVPVQLIEAKDKLCRYSQDLKRYRSRGYPGRELELCHCCATRPECPYWSQFDPSKTWALATKYLVTDLLERHHNNPELVLIDETSLGDLIVTRQISENDIGDFCRFLQRHQLFTPALEQLTDALFKCLRDENSHRDPHIILSLSPHLDNPVQVIQEVSASTEYGACLDLTKRGEIETLPPGQVLDLIGELAAEASRPGQNSRISFRQGKIVLRNFKNLNCLDCYPVLVLDASADRNIYKRIFPNRTIEMLSHPVEVQAKIFQITNSPMGKKQLKDPKVFKRVVKFIQKHRQQKIGIICPLEFKSALENEFPGAVIGHYWAIRGSRQFECCDTLFLVGGAFMRPEDLKRLASAIYFNESKISHFSRKTLKDYGMRRGNKQIFGLYEYTDPRLQALADLFQKEEMRQAAFRIRPLQENKTIYILSNIPLGLPPTKLLKLNNNSKQEIYLEYANKLKLEHKRVTNRAISAGIGISERQGKKYFKLIKGK